ncbi:MAG: hypothetical protein ACP5E5_14380 [Acidobacteriaceae bacterium]
MRSLFAIVTAILLQAGVPSIESIPPAKVLPQDFRYVRSLSLPKGASGVACTVLYGSVYAHASSPSLDDLRVFRVAEGGRWDGRAQEVPFAVRYSQAEPSDEQTATVSHLQLHRGELEFDLAMPARPYTQLDLHLAARNFVATATVRGIQPSTGRRGDNPTARPLGEFVLFDLTAQHLARSTSLAFQESRFPTLHVWLRLRSLNGAVFPNLSPAIVQGATVPASREAQTLYSVVASTSAIVQSGGTSIAEFHVPAHVPIERVRFILNPDDSLASPHPPLSSEPAEPLQFLRRVEVTAQAEGEPTGREGLLSSGDEDGPQQEVVRGEIWRVARPAAFGAPEVHAARLALAAVIASDLNHPATVRVVVEDQGQPRLGIHAVELEMRQRTLCFDARAGSSYALWYGDPGLDEDEPGEGWGDLANVPTAPMVAKLGLEEVNRGYVRQSVESTYGQRNPTFRWIVLLTAVAVLGTVVNRQATRQGRRR